MISLLMLLAVDLWFESIYNQTVFGLFKLRDATKKEITREINIQEDKVCCEFFVYVSKRIFYHCKSSQCTYVNYIKFQRVSLNLNLIFLFLFFLLSSPPLSFVWRHKCLLSLLCPPAQQLNFRVSFSLPLSLSLPSLSLFSLSFY